MPKKRNSTLYKTKHPLNLCNNLSENFYQFEKPLFSSSQTLNIYNFQDGRKFRISSKYYFKYFSQVF